jgi:photosystem II stability/assembly factor-like uncharacterized protein
MATNLGDDVFSVYDGLSYAYDKVFFQPGKPPLAAELNDAQQYVELLSQKSTGHLPSGWLTSRPFYTSSDLENKFYTQSPTGAKPEVALVNGWPIYVTNTNTSLKHINSIDLQDFELRSGTRVDGVFLEVWRKKLSPDREDMTAQSAKPQPLRITNDINGLDMYDQNIGWAVGDNGVILKTTDGGNNWTSKETPVSVSWKAVKFLNSSLGYAVGSGGYVIKSTNGGESWFVLETEINDTLNDLEILDSKTIVVVGNNGTVLLSIDGSTFNVITQTSGATSDFNGVFFFDSSVGWIVGNSGTLLLTLDGGESWSKQTITDSGTNLEITTNLNSVAFYNLNDGIAVGDDGLILKSSDGGRNWANVSDRVWTGTNYKTLEQIDPRRENHLNKVFIRRNFPLDFSLSVYPASKNFFTAATYSISPAANPNSLVLEWRGVQDGQSYSKVLDLELYGSAESLRDAINNITSPYLASDVSSPSDERRKTRVFEAVVNFAPVDTPSNIKPTSGKIPSSSTTNITFSVEGRAWIAGNDGLVLTTLNSGSRWEISETGKGVDFYNIEFLDENIGWVVGAEGLILKYDPANQTTNYEEQTTDLSVESTERVYPEGNILSDAEDFLEDTMVDPNVGVETTKRVQIQYRIRIIDGVDPFNYPEAGLGAQYVYSQGPNDNTSDAGRYTYVNMGEENGDYGLWRSRCRNTFDGFTWAIPMFFVSRRNSSPFNIESNINGSTYFELGAVRPDGLTYEQIVDTDIVDLRRKININSYSHLLEQNLDALLNNELRTKLDNRDNRGTQFSTNIMGVDSFEGTSAIGNLVTGGVSSTAVVREDVRQLDPTIALTEQELTFGPREKALYHNDEAFYSAVIVRDGVITTEPVEGTWQGLGTNSVTFILSEDNVAENGIEYRFTASYIDYSGVGLNRVPYKPLGIKYIADATSDSRLYRGINSRSVSETIETLSERVTGYPDYTVAYSGRTILDNKESRDLYKLAVTADEGSTSYNRSVRNFKGQQFRGSLVEYHYFVRTTTSTSKLEIPKNINDYSIFSVRQIKGINGSIYKISNSYATGQTLRDWQLNDQGQSINSSIVIYLDDSFIIPADTVVEVVMEVTTAPSNLYSDLGITVSNEGENQGALRTPYISNYDVGSKGIGGIYTSVLFPVMLNTDDQRSFEIDLNNQTPIQADIPYSGFPEFLGMNELIGGSILGLSTIQTDDSNNQLYVWYQENSGSMQFTALPIESIAATDDDPDNTGLGTSSVVVNIDRSVTTHEGLVYVPMLVKQATLPSLGDTSIAYATYYFRPYQTLNTLPDTLSVEIMKSYENVYVSNLGTGSTPIIRGEPYQNPIEHIPVNDPNFLNENIFSNVDDLDFINFSVDSGFVKLPAIISRTLGKTITLSNPNNVGDKLGRAYYTECSEDFRAQSEDLTIATPRKVFVPMIARIRSAITTPFLRGELVLLIVSKVYKARVDNSTGFYEDENVEYQLGFTEEAETAVGVYRLSNKPIVRM